MALCSRAVTDGLLYLIADISAAAATASEGPATCVMYHLYMLGFHILRRDLNGRMDGRRMELPTTRGTPVGGYERLSGYTDRAFDVAAVLRRRLPSTRPPKAVA